MNDVKTRNDIDEAVFPVIEFGRQVTAEALKQLAERYQNLPDVRTDDGYEQRKDGVKECTSLRTTVERRRKDLKRDALEWGRRVDREAKDITAAILAIEKPMRDEKEIIDEERRAEARRQAEAEQARVNAIREAIYNIKALAANRDQYEGSVAIAEAIKRIQDESFTEGRYAEFLDEAIQARDATLYRLEEWYRVAVMREAEDRYRKEEAERLAEERRQFEAEQAEARKRQEVELAIGLIRSRYNELVGAKSHEIDRAIRSLEREDMSAERWGEHHAQAVAVHDETLAKMRELHARVAQQEERDREAEEAERRRQEEAERQAEAEREEQLRREAEARQPTIDKLRSWVAAIEQAQRAAPTEIGDDFKAPVDTLYRSVGRAAEKFRRQIDKLDA